MRSMMCVAVVFAAALIGGCKSEQKEPKAFSQDFLPDDANRTLWRALEVQSAAGAAADGMLYSSHFEGAELSDLGRDKLDLMARSEPRPLVVYVNVADDSQTAARQASVSRFLSSAGLSADEMQLKDGANPSAKTAAAPNLARMWKTENPGRDSAGTGGGSMSSGGQNSDLDSSGISP